MMCATRDIETSRTLLNTDPSYSNIYPEWQEKRSIAQVNASETPILPGWFTTKFWPGFKNLALFNSHDSDSKNNSIEANHQEMTYKLDVGINLAL